MPTKTISSRIDETQLAFVNALTHQAYGQSFGQYITATLVPEIERTGHLPVFDKVDYCKKRDEALEFIRTYPDTISNPEIGLMSDEEIKNLIASRYE